VRDLDAHEKKFHQEMGVKALTMREIDERGMREVMSDALKYAMDDTAGIAVSLDMDFVDPSGRARRRYARARRSRTAKHTWPWEMIAGQRGHGVHGNCRDQSRH